MLGAPDDGQRTAPLAAARLPSAAAYDRQLPEASHLPHCKGFAHKGIARDPSRSNQCLDG